MGLGLLFKFCTETLPLKNNCVRHLSIEELNVSHVCATDVNNCGNRSTYIKYIIKSHELTLQSVITYMIKRHTLHNKVSSSTQKSVITCMIKCHKVHKKVCNAVKYHKVHSVCYPCGLGHFLCKIAFTKSTFTKSQKSVIKCHKVHDKVS
jgi:hypothetical protein